MFYNLTPEQMINLMNDPQFVLIFTLIAIWSLIWKGIALWKASQNKSKIWFIFLMGINTVGILEIIYIYLVNGNSRLGKKENNLPNNLN